MYANFQKEIMHPTNLAATTEETLSYQRATFGNPAPGLFVTAAKTLISSLLISSLNYPRFQLQDLIFIQKKKLKTIQSNQNTITSNHTLKNTKKKIETHYQSIVL